MQEILLVVHLLLAIVMIGFILLQHSEGGALGIGGGGGGGGGFMTGRATANFLTRATTVLAALFFATSMGLTLMSAKSTAPIVPGIPSSAGAPAKPGPAAKKPAPAKPSGPSAPVK